MTLILFYSKLLNYRTFISYTQNKLIFYIPERDILLNATETSTGHLLRWEQMPSDFYNLHAYFDRCLVHAGRYRYANYYYYYSY